MESLRQSKQLKLIVTRHEQAAAMMAATVGRLTGAPPGSRGTSRVFESVSRVLDLSDAACCCGQRGVLLACHLLPRWHIQPAHSKTRNGTARFWVRIAVLAVTVDRLMAFSSKQRSHSTRGHNPPNLSQDACQVATSWYGSRTGAF